MEVQEQERRSADMERRKDNEKSLMGVHRCTICGFTTEDVGSLTIHLDSAHPTTVQPHLSRRCTSSEEHRSKEEGENVVEEKKPLPTCSSEERRPRTIRQQDAGEEFEENNRRRDSVEPASPDDVTKAQNEQTPLRSVATSSQRKPLPSPPEKTQEKTLPTCPATPVTATSGLNRPHVVCLPQVAERLKLAWQRSDPVHELDGQLALVEAFNAFPYPTSQETGALARQCSLPIDDVKTWFMMQRVRYGISWAEEDIRESRHKLHTLQSPLGSSSKEVEAAADVDLDVSSPARGAEEVLAADGAAAATLMDVDDQFVYDYDDDDDGEEEEMMRAFGASEGMIAERKRDYMPAALWSAPPLSQLEPPLNADGLPRPAMDEPPRFHPQQPTPLGVLSSAQPSASLPFSIAGQPGGRMRSKKSRAQLMILRRSFVVSNWPSEAELQRLQIVTGLGRHEIRKWFADSRYQLRRSGGDQRTTLRGTQVLPAGQEWRLPPPDVLPPRTSLPDGQVPAAPPHGPGPAEVEVVIKQEHPKDVLRTFIQSKDEHAKLAAGGQVAPSFNGHSEASAVSSAASVVHTMPTSPPSLVSYQLPGYPGSLQGSMPGVAMPEIHQHQRLRKKTSEQTEVLRQTFLRCQWPTAEDYSRLEQMTGLPRTQIIHWFGDTRYSFKHSRLRWIGPEERRDIATRLEMDAHRAWLVRRHKQWPALGLDGPPQPSPGNWMDASNSSNSSVQTLDGMAGGDFDRWYELWDGAVPGPGGSNAGAGGSVGGVGGL